MPQLLKDILYVMETFYNYAKEDGNKATMTCRELKQLIQGEFGDILQPSVIHAVERKLDLLDIDSDGNITFEEFLLAMFNLLNLCYLDIQSLLNSEARPMSQSGGNPDDGVQKGTNKTCQMTEGILPVQDKERLPSGIESSAQLSPEESKQDEHNRAQLQGDTKTHGMPGESSGISVTRNQRLVGDEQSQEGPQDAHTRGNNEIQLETNKPTAESRHTGNSTKQVGGDKEIPEERDKLDRKQNDGDTREQFGGKGRNLGIQSSPQEATTQKPLKDQDIDLEMSVKEHNKIQVLQRKDDLRSEHTGLEQTVVQKSCLTQKFTVHEEKRKEDETEGAKRTQFETKNSAETKNTTSEIQEPPAQETKKLPVQGEGRITSEILDVRAERKEGRNPGVCGIAEQRESERKTQPLTLADQTQEKYQELQESCKERDTQKCSMAQELSLEGRKRSHSRIERAAILGEEQSFGEKCKAEILMRDENMLAATAGTSGSRDQRQEMASLDNKSGNKNKEVGQTSDQPISEDGGYQGQDHESVTKSEERSSKTCRSPFPKDRDRSSEKSNLSVQGESQRQADSLGESVQESQTSNPDIQEQVALDEENITQEIVGLSGREEDEQLTEEQKIPVDRKHQNHQSSGTKSPGPAIVSNELSEGQEFIEDENTKSLEMEIPGALENYTDKFSIPEHPEEEDSRKKRKILNASTREEGEKPKIREILVKNMSENNSASPNTHFKTQEPATWKEKEIPQEDGQQETVNKGHNSSVSQSDQKEVTQKDQQSFSPKRETVYSNPLYTYLQENVLQQTDIIQNQSQPLPIKSLSPELGNNPSGALLTGNSQASPQCTKEFLDEGQKDTQQTAPTQAQEDKQGLIERSQDHQKKEETESTE